jgi:hypothetical protein
MSAKKVRLIVMMLLKALHSNGKEKVTHDKCIYIYIPICLKPKGALTIPKFCEKPKVHMCGDLKKKIMGRYLMFLLDVKYES